MRLKASAMRCVRRVSIAHSWVFFLSDVDPSDADNEASSSEESSVERFDEGRSSSVISPQ